LGGPKPITREALYVWLHECGHAHHPEDYFDENDFPKLPDYLLEFEAETFSPS
jgi:hypothetical protein